VATAVNLDFQESVDILAAVYRDILEVEYLASLGSLDILALACRATVAIRAKAAFLDLAEFLDLVANRATAVNKAFPATLGLVCQDIAALGFLVTVAYLVTAALAYRDIAAFLDTAVAASLATLAAAYQVTVEHLAIAVVACPVILDYPAIPGLASVAIQVNLDTVV
jgi:hypothetical protein